MGTVPVTLAEALKGRLGLRRAVETGTWVGGGALLLSDVFGDVTTIERSEEVARRAQEILRREPISVVHGDSRAVLRPSTEPTFYFLDAHWMGGITAGVDDQCPVLDELDAIAGGHADDCVVIDDARLFVEPPPAPHRPEAWPRVEELEERFARHWPEHVVLAAHDQIVAVPTRAADVARRWAAAPFQEPRRRRTVVTRLVRWARRAIRRTRSGSWHTGGSAAR